MVAELARRSRIADRGLGLQQQGEASPLDQALLAAGPADEALQGRHVGRVQLGVIGG